LEYIPSIGWFYYNVAIDIDEIDIDEIDITHSWYR
jgi:hypothetical protein